MSRQPRLRGFTLLELLVAIAVLAIVSIIAWRGLDSLVKTRERLEPAGTDARALLAAFGQFERDLAQIARPEFFGLTDTPVQVRLAASGPVLEIVRIAAPGAEGGSTRVQTIFWRVGDGYLLRQSSPAVTTLGPISSEQLGSVRLLADVKAIRVRVWREGNSAWSDALDPANSGAPVAPPGTPGAIVVPLPQGLELTIERADGKTYRRVALVG